MSLTTGNITTNFTNPIPSSTTRTFSHTQDSGSNRLLVVITHSLSTNIPLSVTYDGVSLTLEQNWNNVSTGWNARVWSLVNPSQGLNNIVVTYPNSFFLQTARIALSFTNAIGIGAMSINAMGGVNTPRSVTLNVANDSKIIATGISTGGVATWIRVPDPTMVPFEWNKAISGGRGTFGGVSANLAAGNNTYTARDDNGAVYPMGIEVQQATTSSPIFGINQMVM